MGGVSTRIPKGRSIVVDEFNFVILLLGDEPAATAKTTSQATSAPSKPGFMANMGKVTEKPKPITMSPTKSEPKQMTMKEMREAQEAKENRDAANRERRGPATPFPSTSKKTTSPVLPQRPKLQNYIAPGGPGHVLGSEESAGSGRSPSGPSQQRSPGQSSLTRSPGSSLGSPAGPGASPRSPGQALRGDRARTVRQTTPDQDELRRKRLAFLEKQNTQK